MLAVSKTLATKQPSLNMKLHDRDWTRLVFSTYRPVKTTCPETCPYLDKSGCYAMEGRTKWFADKAETLHSIDLVDYIQTRPRGSVIRHLVSGDLFLNGDVDDDYVREMVEGHKRRPQVTGWAYTHGWQKLTSQTVNCLPNLCVNASTDSKLEAAQALNAGWPTVMTTKKHGKGLFDFGDFYGVVCPAQTNKHMTCAKCMLCAKHDRKVNGKPLVILFEWHKTPCAPKDWRDPLEAFRDRGVIVRR